MKTRRQNWMAIMLALATTGLLASAAEVTLKVGDPAPKLQVGKWVQGDPVKSFEKGKAYIVEFWATWCGPCRVSIPHLNEIANAYKDKKLVVIGQDCWERDESLVKPFIEKMGDKMTYRVALDNKEGSEQGKMAETWMKAAGQNGIPSAFLVDTKGIIAWIGHPMSLKEKIIDAVLDGTYDVTKAAAEFENEKKNETELRALWQDLNKAMKEKDWAKAEEIVSKAEKLLTDEQKKSLGMLRFNLQLNKGDYPAAYKIAAQISDDNKDNPGMQNELAWHILTDTKIKERDLKLAQKIALRANEAAKGKDPAILDTLARAYFVNGDKTKAIECQEQAVKLAEGEVKDSLKANFEAYKKGQLPESE